MTNAIFFVGHLYVFDETVIGLCTKVHENGKFGNFCNTMNLAGRMLTPEERKALKPEQWREVTDEERRFFYDQMVKPTGKPNDHYDGEDALKAGTVCRVTIDGIDNEYMCVLCTDIEPQGKLVRQTNTMLTYSLTEQTGVEQCPWNDSVHINIYCPTDEQIVEFWEYWDEASSRGYTL